MSGRERVAAPKEEEGAEEKAAAAAAAAAAYIPADLHGEILSWLPSYDLLNLKLVCKEWRRLISSSRFIKKHLERSKTERLIVASFVSRETEIIDCANKTRTHKTKKIYLGCCLRLLGSCDGLVLYYDPNRHKIGALNPSTRNSVVRTPHPSMGDDIQERWGGLVICSWLGHHPSTGEYVLVLVRRQEATRVIQFKVYSLSRSGIDDDDGDSLLSSSSIEEEQLDGNNLLYYYSSREKRGALLHGRLHCPTAAGTILGYDFETNRIERMWGPVAEALGVVDGCLCAIYCRKAKMHEMWMMKEYGCKESWTKYAKIVGFSNLIPLAFCPNGDYVFFDCNGSKLSKYSFRHRKTELLKAYTAYDITGIMCVDSLVSPALLWRKEN